MLKPEWWSEWFEHARNFDFNYKEYLKEHPTSKYSMADEVEARNKKAKNDLSNFEIKRPFEL